jgi:RND family efflux transporter MFP subunit
MTGSAGVVLEKAKLEQLRIERAPEKAPTAMGRWVLAGCIAALLAAVAWFVFKPAPVIEVSTAVARELKGGDAGTVLNASGYVTARRQATVSSKFTGKVAEVLIEEGMVVTEGQVLARLDSSNVDTDFQLAEAQLRAAQSGLKSTRVRLDEARRNLARLQTLVEKKLVSTADLDHSKAEADALAAQLESEQAGVNVVARQLDVYRQQVEDTTIRAPFAGVVVAKNAQPGEMISPVSAGGGFTRTGIGTIVDMSSLEIEVDVNEAYINRVTPGQAVLATLDAYPDWRIACHVIAIIPTADRQRATVAVRVGFDALDPRILPDMGAKVAFQEADSSRLAAIGVTVPLAAIQTESDRSHVLVVNDGRIERRAVSLGAETGTDVVVIGSLASGTRVVVDAPAGLADGVMVRERDQ